MVLLADPASTPGLAAFPGPSAALASVLPAGVTELVLAPREVSPPLTPRIVGWPGLAPSTLALPGWSPVDLAVGPLAVVPPLTSLRVDRAAGRDPLMTGDGAAVDADTAGPDERPAVSFDHGGDAPESVLGDPVHDNLKPGEPRWPGVLRVEKGDLDVAALPQNLGFVPGRQDHAPDGAVPLALTGSPLGGTSPAAEHPVLAGIDSRITATGERPIELAASPVAGVPSPAVAPPVVLASLPSPSLSPADEPPLLDKEPDTSGEGAPGPVPLSGADRDKALGCLARAVYFEARSESGEGQEAVAQVVLNRFRSPYYPKDVCAVVYQGVVRHRWGGCQFSFACTGISQAVGDRRSWAQAQAVAHKAMDGQDWLPAVGRATHYHANYVHPRWVRDMRRQDRIGRHIFYTVRWWDRARADGA